MKNSTPTYKLILACNKQGVVEQLFLDTGSLFNDLKLPVGLHSLVSPLSIKELGIFWLSIQEKSMEENTVLTLGYNDKEVTYVFSGYLLKEKVLLCGSTELTATEKVLEEIMSINNEQANQIRLTEKKANNILKKGKKDELDDAFLNDFSALNNELINNKRELMRKNQKIELLNQELNTVNENMTRFTYSISHDLKEPVRMVKSFLSLLDNKYRDRLDEKGQKYVEFALDGANRLSKMMADLLKFHRSTNFDSKEFVDLNEVLLDVKEILQKEIEEKNAQISSENLPTLKGSSAGFLQVFQNLISNAIKFVPKGNTPVVTIILKEQETHYIFMVKDNGIGIAENQQQEVFNLFKRLNMEYEGTGMGLAMVRKSIERLGGNVWLESEEGKGTTVIFTLKKD